MGPALAHGGVILEFWVFGIAGNESPVGCESRRGLLIGFKICEIR